MNTNPISYLYNFFRPQNKSIKISEIKIGDMVELTYYHPKDTGSLNGNLICTRLNPDELENRTIKGIITNVFLNKELFQRFVEVKTCKVYNDVPVERKFFFFESEIEKIRKIE